MQSNKRADQTVSPKTLLFQASLASTHDFQYQCACRRNAPPGFRAALRLPPLDVNRTGCAGLVQPALRRNGQGVGEHAGTRCGRLCKSVLSSTLAVRCLYVTKYGSPTHRRPRCAFTPRLKHVAASCGRRALALPWGH